MTYRLYLLGSSGEGFPALLTFLCAGDIIELAIVSRTGLLVDGGVDSGWGHNGTRALW